MPTVKSRSAVAYPHALRPESAGVRVNRAPTAPPGFRYYNGRLWELPNSFWHAWGLAIRDMLRRIVIACLLLFYGGALAIVVYVVIRILQSCQ